MTPPAVPPPTDGLYLTGDSLPPPYSSVRPLKSSTFQGVRYRHSPRNGNGPAAHPAEQHHVGTARQVPDRNPGAYFIIPLHLRPQQASEERMPLDLLAGHDPQDRDSATVPQDFSTASGTPGLLNAVVEFFGEVMPGRTRATMS